MSLDLSTKIADAKKKIKAWEFLKKRVEKDNIAFEKASPAQKRVMIAKDVIAQIKSHRFKPKHLAWLEIKDPTDEFNDSISTLDFQSTFFEENKIECSGCALGSIIMSATLFKDKLNIVATKTAANSLFSATGKLLNAPGYDYLGDDVLGINKIFSPDQLLLIELAFEGDRGASNSVSHKNWFLSVVSFSSIAKAKRFHYKYKSPTGRLVGIMQNIIKNKGTFKP